jgi:transposase-like protein
MFDSHSSKKPARKQAGRALSAADGRFFTVFSRHRRYLGAEKRPRLTAANYPSFPIAAPPCYDPAFAIVNNRLDRKLSLASIIETSFSLVITYLLIVLVWHRPPLNIQHTKKAAKSSGTKRKWKPKSPHDCPACQEGIRLSIRPIQRNVQPWHERKSSRGRKKTIATQGYACLNPACDYHGITDECVHALVGNGKRGQRGDIQTLKCQCCGSSFSTRRNTPLYYLKTNPTRIEMSLWLLAEGVHPSQTPDNSAGLKKRPALL